MPVNLTKTLDIVDDRNVLKHRISFNEVDLVSDVLNQIRTKQQLAPNVQIIFIGIDGLKQSAPAAELQGNDRMWQHFPHGGKVRIDTNVPAQAQTHMTIRDNVAHAEAIAHNIIAFKSEENRKATMAIIERNQTYEGAAHINAITDDTSFLANLNWGAKR